MKLIIATPLLVAMSTTPATAQGLTAAIVTATDSVRQALLAGQLMVQQGLKARPSIATASLTPQAAGYSLKTRLNGQPVDVLLERASIRTPDFTVTEIGEDGNERQAQAPPNDIFFGTISNQPGTSVMAQLSANYLNVETLRAINPDTNTDIIASSVKGNVLGKDNELASINRKDMRPSSINTPALRGKPMKDQTRQVPAGAQRRGKNETVVYVRNPITGDLTIDEIATKVERNMKISRRRAATTPVGQTVRAVRLVVDTDYEFFLAWGKSVASVTRKVQQIVGTVNQQYQRQLGITHLIAKIQVRTARTPAYKSTDCNVMLDEVMAVWSANTAVKNDVVIFMTGKNMNDGVLGLAYVRAVCTDYAFAVTQVDAGQVITDSTDIVAHELGHSWGADHCNCPTYTMNPYITGANNFDAAKTIPAIKKYLAASGQCASTVRLGGCTTDAHCQNNVFCDGKELCRAGKCVKGTAPCGTGFQCVEASKQCLKKK